MKYLISLFFLAVLCLSCENKVKVIDSLESSQEDIGTQVFKASELKTSVETFGTITAFLEGKSTFGMKNVVTGIISLKPNTEVHPPHKHAEEEYLLVTKGSGIWVVKNDTFPAQAGDLLYAAPWDLHGIFNNDSTDLEFYFIKWNSKGVSIPDER